LGDRIPLVPLLLPKDPNSAEQVAQALSIADVALLAGNGAIAVGVDLEQAYLRLELVEHYARILSIAAGLGGPAQLERAQVEKLLEMRKKAGLGPRVAAAIRPIVAEELRKVLGDSK